MKINTEAGRLICETAAAYGWSQETGVYALARAANSFAAADAERMSVDAEIIFPPQADRTKAYAMEKKIRKVCREYKIELKNTKIRQNPLYRTPVVLISGIGLGRKDIQTDEGKDGGEGRDADEGRDIVLVKWIGMEGMLHIVDEKEDELRQRFAPVFINQIQSRRDGLFAGKELKIARSAGVSLIHQITEGGILAALWELSQKTGMGIEADMKRMSVLQETIEICEHYRLNPYQLTSAGSFLMLAKDGEALADELEKNQIRASVIGRIAEGNGKVLHNGEDMRYIDRPAPDEIYKIWI